MKLIPTGIENFKTMIDKNAYYVDKTNLIADILNEQVVLYTRPRRFGKTLNMSMLYYFFSIKEKENAYLNASVVGYCTPLVSSYKMIVDRVNINSSTSESDAFWYDNWAKAVEKYYQLEDDGSMNINGVPLSFFDTEELTKIGNIVNNVKSK